MFSHSEESEIPYQFHEDPGKGADLEHNFQAPFSRGFPLSTATSFRHLASLDVTELPCGSAGSVPAAAGDRLIKID